MLQEVGGYQYLSSMLISRHKFLDYGGYDRTTFLSRTPLKQYKSVYRMCSLLKDIMTQSEIKKKLWYSCILEWFTKKDNCLTWPSCDSWHISLISCDRKRKWKVTTASSARSSYLWQSWSPTNFWKFWRRKCQLTICHGCKGQPLLEQFSNDRWK